jgi:hypothetical protein
MCRSKHLHRENEPIGVENMVECYLEDRHSMNIFTASSILVSDTPAIYRVLLESVASYRS